MTAAGGGGQQTPTGFLRVRFGLDDTHYADGLIPAAGLLKYFADCCSEIGIRMDGVDGYLAAYESAGFLKPVHAGDWIEIHASLVARGNRSRRIRVEARRCIEAKRLGDGLSGGILHDPPELVAEAVLVIVKPRADSASHASGSPQ